MEAESFASFPDAIECDKCGGRHNFAEEDTTVLFLRHAGVAPKSSRSNATRK